MVLTVDDDVEGAVFRVHYTFSHMEVLAEHLFFRVQSAFSNKERLREKTVIK